MKDCPLFNEMPYKFNLDNLSTSGLDVLLYNQDYYDTLSILQNKKDVNQETIDRLISG